MFIKLYNELFLMSAVFGGLYLILKVSSITTMKYFKASWHYYTYTAVYMFLLLPYHKLVSLFNFNQKISTELSLPMSSSIVSFPSSGNVDFAAVTDKAGHVQMLNLNFWPYLLIIGTLVFVIIILIQNVRLHQRIFRVCHLTDDVQYQCILTKCKQKIRISDCVPVYVSPYASTPFLYGVFKPRIVLPNIEFTEEELQHIFLHELTHWKRHDAWLKCLMLLMNAIHWFNPLAYIARHDIERFSELSCDESVVRSMNNEERKRYCELMLGVLWNVTSSNNKVFSAFSDKRKQLERRMSMIMENKSMKSKKWVRMFAVVMAIALTMGGAITASAYTVSDYGVISENSMYAMPEAAIPSIESIEEEAVSAESSNSIFIPASVDIGPMSVYYIKDLGINANSAKNITSPTGNAYNLIKGKTFDFDLTWYPRNAVKVGLYDTATGEVQNIKIIKDGSGQGSIKVPYDGKFYFYIWNTGDSYITVNGSIDA